MQYLQKWVDSFRLARHSEKRKGKGNDISKKRRAEGKKRGEYKGKASIWSGGLRSKVRPYLEKHEQWTQH